MSRTFDTLGNDTVDVVFDNLGFLHGLVTHNKVQI